MDEKTFKERVARLNEVSKVIEKLPSEIRAPAFPLLVEYITGGSLHSEQHPPGKRTLISPGGQHRETSSDDKFFSEFSHDKPSDNVRMIAAYFYREYGSEGFSTEEVKSVASDVGVTIPSRIDMTFRQAKENGKKLFTLAGKGKFKPTVHGETYLKTTYSVKKGTKNRPMDTESK